MGCCCGKRKQKIYGDQVMSKRAKNILQWTRYNEEIKVRHDAPSQAQIDKLDREIN